MASGDFSAYAPPFVFGPWMTAIGGLGFATGLRIDVTPVGDTTVFGEVRYYNEASQETVQPFQGTIYISTCNCLQNVEVRFKGVPLGSAVEGNWQTVALSRGSVPTDAPQALSLHIGLNHVDPEHYNGWDGELRACENDALDMRAIAVECGYKPKTLLSNEATSSAVVKALAQAARRLTSGDIFLLTYAGHGSQVPDVNGDEDDGLDETWLLFDRMLSDDELYTAWARFKPGVRIVMVSDSCHSGTMARDPVYRGLGENPSLMAEYGCKTLPKYRVLPDDIAQATYELHQDLYDAIAWSCVDGDRATIAASVVMLAACQDSQTAADGAVNGKFTEKLKEVWGDGYQGTYYTFLKAIRGRMPKTQTPHYFTVGVQNPSFENSNPFSIS